MGSLKYEPDIGPDTWTARDKYGWGTEIRLNGEQTEKLGITNLRAGTPVKIIGMGIVTRSEEVLEPGDDSGGKDLEISIQLTEITVKATGPANAKKAANVLYGDDDEE